MKYKISQTSSTFLVTEVSNQKNKHFTKIFWKNTDRKLPSCGFRTF